MRRIIARTSGKTHGPITRLMSPSDLGRLLKPFIFLDYVDAKGNGPNFGFHPHSGIATLTFPLTFDIEHTTSTGQVDTFVMGLNYTMPADTETMTYIRNLLPTGANWQGFGIGRNQFPMAMQSALLGGHVRVGMEDNAYISRGEFANSNAQLVRKAVRIVEDLGSSIASPDEARRILGLSPIR